MKQLELKPGRGPYGHFMVAYTCDCGKPMQARKSDVIAGRVRRCKSCANRARKGAHEMLTVNQSQELRSALALKVTPEQLDEKFKAYAADIVARNAGMSEEAFAAKVVEIWRLRQRHAELKLDDSIAVAARVLADDFEHVAHRNWSERSDVQSQLFAACSELAAVE